MHVLQAQPAVHRIVSRRTRVAPLGSEPTHCAVVAVDTVGYLVPKTRFTGRVQSVFAKACNVSCNGTLLTLCAPRVGVGPLTLRLASGGPQDLRELFEIGERIDASQGRVRSQRAELRWAQADVWRPAKLGALLGRARIDARLHVAAARLTQFRHSHPSVIDGAGAPVAVALREACQALDDGLAALQIKRLIGWGEGLTPAGDDFLVGVLAGLNALVQYDPRRLRFRNALAAAITSLAGRTTLISAHHLRLAARGHFGEPLVSLRDALIAEPTGHLVDQALQAALNVGATSGADTVSGLLAGLAAWPAPV